MNAHVLSLWGCMKLSKRMLAAKELRQQWKMFPVQERFRCQNSERWNNPATWIRILYAEHIVYSVFKNIQINTIFFV